MITLFFVHIVITSLCFIAGQITYYFFGEEEQNRPIVYYLITGLAVLTILGQVAVLVIPVNYSFSIALLATALIGLSFRKLFFSFLYGLILRQTQNLHPFTIFGFLISWILIIMLNAGPTLMDDTESYHIQMVKWIQEFGTVPGIANLHERFGFNSSWFTSIALFTFPSEYNFFTALNGILSVWFAFHLWSQINILFYKPLLKENALASFFSLFILLFSMLLWPVLRGNASTANYDFITSIITVLLFLEVFKKNTESGRQFDPGFEFFFWPIYLFTVRIINFPLCILSIYAIACILKQKRIKKLCAYLSLGFVTVIPFLARNVLLSGYPFYPSTYFNWFEVDWKVDETVINELLRFIKYFNRMNTMFQSIEDTQRLTFPGWVFVWYRHLFINDKLLTTIGLSGFLAATFFFRKYLFRYRLQALLYCTIIIQVFLWFVIAPDPRFIYGCLLCGAALAFTPIFNLASKHLQIIVYSGTAFLVIFTSSLVAYKPFSDPQYRNFILPHKIPQPPIKEIHLDHANLHIPEKILNNWNPRCYATPLPCLYKVDPRLHLRGKTIREGFSIR